MYLSNLITAIKLPFCKERQLYRSLYAILGFYPRHISLYKQALMHKSFLAKTSDGAPVHNERLEFLGDAILDAVVGDIVYHHFKGKQEGFLTTTRSNVVKRETLGQIAVEIGLDKLVMSHCNRQCHNSYLGGNAFEAMIGAIYLDYGYNRCRQFVKERMLKRFVDLNKMAYKEQNYKSKLLEWGQKNRYMITFQLLSETKDHSGAPEFYTQALVEGVVCGKGRGFSKKESQQNASRSAYNAVKSSKDLVRRVQEAQLQKLDLPEAEAEPTPEPEPEEQPQATPIPAPEPQEQSETTPTPELSTGETL